MASFTALNIELESDSEEEIDDTKEIQVEEALKLYQNALKLHSQGPRFFDEAEQAYEALFDSEIFSYPESQSLTKRIALKESVDESEYGDYVVGQSNPPTSSNDAAPNTLPQILYLSYKNHGQFLLDRLIHRIGASSEHAKPISHSGKETRSAASESLQLFAEALNKDETDFDLWRRTSRISRYLGSRRLARFSLETVLEGRPRDDAFWSERDGLDEVFAREELEELVSLLQDELSELQMDSSFPPRKGISRILKVRMDPFPELPDPSTQSSTYESVGGTKIIDITECRWTAMGKAILSQWEAEMRTVSNADFGNRYEVMLSNEQVHDPSGTTEPRKLKNVLSAETLFKSRPLTSPTSLQMAEPQGEDVTMIDATTDKGPEAHKKSLGDNDTTEINVSAPHLELDNTEDTKPSSSSDRIKAPSTNGVNTTDSRLSLKRSSDFAGFHESGEGGRSRSKRLRAKAEVAADEEIDPKDLSKQHEELLQQYAKADQWLFSVVHELCAKSRVVSFSDVASLTQISSVDKIYNGGATTDDAPSFLDDLKDSLCSWDLNKSNLLIHGTGSGASVTLLGGGNDSGLAAFLEHSKTGGKKTYEQDMLLDQGLIDFVRANNKSWNDIDQLAFFWIESLLRPSIRIHKTDREELESPLQLEDSKYVQYTWPTSLKETVSQILVEEDAVIYSTAGERIAQFDETRVEYKFPSTLQQRELEATIEFIQAIFECHLDIYGKTVSPSSKADQPTRTIQRDRLRRWAALSSIAMSKQRDDETTAVRNITFRHLWSSVIYVSLIEAASREHILLCLKDLKLILEGTEFLPLYLQNSSIMPEISSEAAEREISKLTTMDFFLSIFDPSIEEPVAVIESLEPVLMGANTTTLDKQSIVDEGAREIKGSQDEEIETQEALPPSVSLPLSHPTRSHEYQMSEFLGKANTSLRLSLWHRLKTAYEAVDFPPMVFLCDIRCMSLIISELQSPAYTEESREDRAANLVVWMRNLGDLATHCLDLVRASSKALDCMDEEHLSMALKSCTEVTRLFHAFVQWDDLVRIGQIQAPQQPSGAVVAHKSAMNFLREMQPKLWMLLYLLLLEAASQDPKSFPTLKEDFVEYLTATHNIFRLRDYCRLGKKSFLKFMKTQLLRLGVSGASESEMSQVIYDLYGLKVCPNSSDLQDHGCVGDQIDRSSALEIIDFVMTQTKKLNIRDLLKSDLKIATEKMQAIIGTPRASSLQQAFNRRIAMSFFKSPINPLNLYRALRGIGGLTGMPIDTEYAMVARKRWFFLLGYILLTRYRSQKRVSPDTSDDLDNAVVFFKLDIDFDVENWETWYRLAQTYDAKIEEDTTWNADKINDPKSDLVAMQRCSIHCYTMAVAGAVRRADDSFETASKLSDLYTDFGNRIYASSRKPFSMKVFTLRDYERFCNGVERGTYKSPPFRELSAPAAWTFAARLFRQAIVDKPDYWINWYMLGKCLWKLFNCSKTSSVSYKQPVDAFIKAIECVPEKRDNRHPEKDPILEPHYKLLAVTHKLVHGRHMTPEHGSKLLGVSPHTRKVTLTDPEEWEGYVLDILKSLRAADKANWHHRMVLRTAHTLYDEMPDTINARAAKHELTQQIFTKTMAVQVWKPEFERTGRHFVYTTRYVLFFIRLLVQVGDRASLEALGKRVRRKQAEFIDHSMVWTEICSKHLKLLRFQGSIPEAHEDTIFKNQLPFERFTLNANRLETWAQSPPASTEPTLDLLRETIELKKLNSNLMKSTLIDDLIGDTYARIYELVVPDLVAKAGEAENRERMRIDRMLMSSDLPQQDVQVTGDQPTAPSRPKAIGRTEVRRRAEALVSRLAVSSVPSRGRPPTSTNVSTSIANQVITNKHLATKDDTGPTEVASSVPGSLHDSADDESELSDIEEEEQEPPEQELAPLFPGLVRSAGEGVDDGADVREAEEEAGTMDVDGKDEGNDVNGEAEAGNEGVS